ncbi:protein of unknown function [Kyrpidia spormannii]|uniref:Uncharacterized protein n=2 Tax=Kyrpidia spormannii TaxID=2055160 RepID=A0ACA8Z8B5_9BACL|nr:protein of unknown function [Kyrpidia spormannii]CAB3392891.1 protein of unknown function [Kyrpidia spormannii]
MRSRAWMGQDWRKLEEEEAKECAGWNGTRILWHILLKKVRNGRFGWQSSGCSPLPRSRRCC